MSGPEGEDEEVAGRPDRMRAMPDSPGPNLRLLAPVAVGVFAVALIVVLITSGAFSGGGGGESATSSGSSSSAERRSERAERRRARRERSTGSATYTIEAGDTLGSIASDNDITVERIQELNPQLDPQALTAGQRIRLRE